MGLQSSKYLNTSPVAKGLEHRKNNPRSASTSPYPFARILSVHLPRPSFHLLLSSLEIRPLPLTMAGSMHLSRLRRWFLASPPIEFAITNLKELLVGALRQGPIPQHVAFVMDGNRRFARSHGIETVEGHNLGFEALARVCRFPSSTHRRAQCSGQRACGAGVSDLILTWLFFY